VVYAQPQWWARHGYHVVIQDVRGRHDSEGDFYPFRTEAEDGYDTIVWLNSHPRCNGRIGMYGFSYQGLTQLLAATLNPPGLQCIAPGMTVGDLYHGWFYQNGALKLGSTISWATQMLRGDARRLGLRSESAALEACALRQNELYAYGPTQAVPPLTQPKIPPYFSDWVTQDRPGEYWARHDISTRYGQIRVPTLHVSGWYDMFGQGSVDLWRNLQSQAAPEAREHQYLIGGPWTHIPWSQFVGDSDCGPAANLDTDAIHLRWFNHWLKDSGEFATESKLKLFVLGRNDWTETNTWPSVESSPTHTLYLHSGGNANSSKGDGTLSPIPPSAPEPSDTFVYEPEIPVGSSPGYGAFRQNRSALFNNVLVFTSAPLEKTLLVTGQARLRLYAKSTAPDTDFVAKWVRITPDGTAWNLSLGIARASYLFRESGFNPDQTSLWEFLLDATCCEFQPGDRLRLEIASSAYPLIDRNPNCGKPAHASDSFDWRNAIQEIFHDPGHPSSLELPLSA
jgi:putative CocE/NonD family hydrolase